MKEVKNYTKDVGKFIKLNSFKDMKNNTLYKIGIDSGNDIVLTGMEMYELVQVIDSYGFAIKDEIVSDINKEVLV